MTTAAIHSRAHEPNWTMIGTVTIIAFLVFLSSTVVIDYLRRHDSVVQQQKAAKIQETTASIAANAVEKTKEQAASIEDRLIAIEAKLDTLIQVLPNASKSK